MKPTVERCLQELDGTTDSFVARFRFPADLPVFQGHFPGHPIVPGIYLIEAVRVAAEKIGRRTLRIARVNDVKITSITGPDADLEITGSLDGSRCRAKWTGGSRIDIEFSETGC